MDVALDWPFPQPSPYTARGQQEQVEKVTRSHLLSGVGGGSVPPGSWASGKLQG